jgi:hypothetical protein
MCQSCDDEQAFYQNQYAEQEKWEKIEAFFVQEIRHAEIELVGHIRDYEIGRLQRTLDFLRRL